MTPTYTIKHVGINHDTLEETWATAETLERAIDGAYDLAGRISFENAYCRRDIGARALAAKN